MLHPSLMQLVEQCEAVQSLESTPHFLFLGNFLVSVNTAAASTIQITIRLKALRGG
jgi:hypothetical protein